MLQFSYIFDKAFTLGINQHDSPDSISEGYVEDAVNVDVEATSLVRRQGYEKYCGDVPLRIEAMLLTESSGDTRGEFILPDYVDLGDLTKGPIELSLYYYRTADTSPQGPNVYRFTETEWTVGDRVVLPSSATTQTFTTLQTGVSSVECLFGLQNTASGETFFVGDVSLDTVSFDLTLGYNTPSDIETFVYTYEPDASLKYFDDSIAPGATLTVSGATHALPTSNLLAVLYSKDGTTLTQIYPESFAIDIASSSVAAVFSETPAGTSLGIFLTSVPDSQTIEGTTDGISSRTLVVIPNATSRQIFASCYLEDITTNTLNQIYPDSIVYDNLTKEHVITFQHPNISFNYRICYAYGVTSTNKLIVDSMGVALLGGDGSQVITKMLSLVHGINQESLPTKSFVNFIDNYTPLAQTVIGVDGMLLKSDSTGISELFDARTRVSPTVVIGPTFQQTVPMASMRRTEGYLVSSSCNSSGYLTVEQVEFNAPYTTYYLRAILYQAYDGSASPISISSLIDVTRDKLTVSHLTNARFNGTFPIISVAHVNSGMISVTVNNSAVTNARWNTSDVAGLAGIFTDQIQFNSVVTAPAGSTLSINTSTTVTVDSTPSSQILNISGVTTTSKLTAGLRLGYSSTSSTTLAGFDLSASELLVGDIVQVGDTLTRVELVDVSAGIVSFREAITVSDGTCQIDVPCRWELIYPANDKLGVDVISRTDVLRSVMGRGSLYLANGVKYDGDKTYRTGIPYIQSQMAVTINDGSGIPVVVSSATYSAGSTTKVITFSDAVDFLSPGDVLIRRNVNGGVVTVDPTDLYLVEAVDTSAKQVTFDKVFTVSVAGTDTLCKYTEYQYFIRLSIVDRNGNYIVGPSVGSSDLRVRLTGPAKVSIKGWVLPNGLENLDYARLNLEIFRRNNSALALNPAVTYRRVDQISLSGKNYYVDFLDSRADEVLGASDEDSLVDYGGGIGETRSAPFEAQHVTAINNQLVYSNLSSAPELSISFFGDATEASFSGKEFVVSYYPTEALSGSASTTFKVAADSRALSSVTFSSDVDGSGTNGFTAVLAATKPSNADIVAGQWIYIANSLPNGCNAQTTCLGWHKVVSYVNATGIISIALPDITALDATDTTNLLLFYIPGSASKIPLANDIDYFNFGQSISGRGSDMRINFPLHLTSAINIVLGRAAAASQLSPIYATGSRDRSTGNFKIAGNRLKSVTFPTAPATTLSLYVNGTNQPWNATYSAVAKTYPSRCILSVPRFPEVFEDIEVDTSINTKLVQDVNPEDGNPVKASIPFFATAAFGAAQQTNVLTIFKPKGIYLLEPQAKLSGTTDYFKKLETRGLGCEAPGSVTASADGVFFASRDGIYLLDKSFRPINAGHKIEHLWDKSLVDLDNLSRIAASNYTRDRKIRFSVPTKTGTNYSDAVLSIKYGEDEMQGIADFVGGWTRYTGFNAVCWASDSSQTYFTTDQGFVGRMLKTGELTDYSDAGEAISCSITFRATDGGMPASRKVLKFVTLYSSSAGDNNVITMSLASDLGNEFTQLDSYLMQGSTPTDEDLLSDKLRDKIDRTAFSPTREKSHSSWHQVKLDVDGNRCDWEVNRIIYRLAPLRTRGEAESSQK